MSSILGTDLKKAEFEGVFSGPRQHAVKAYKGRESKFPYFLSQLKGSSSCCGRFNRTLPTQQVQDGVHSRSKNYTATIIIIRQELGLNRPLSASSNSIFKSLPSRLRPYALYFSIIFGILLFISVTCRSQSRQGIANSLPRTGN
jgi:hypothetical protein